MEAQQLRVEVTWQVSPEFLPCPGAYGEFKASLDPCRALQLGTDECRGEPITFHFLLKGGELEEGDTQYTTIIIKGGELDLEKIRENLKKATSFEAELREGECSLPEPWVVEKCNLEGLIFLKIISFPAEIKLKDTGENK